MRSICATALFDRMYNWRLWESEKQVWCDYEFSWILQRHSHWNILSMARIGKRIRRGRYDDMAFFRKIWGFFCIDPKWWQEVIFSNCWGDETWVFGCDKQTTTRNHLWGSNPDRDQQPMMDTLTTCWCNENYMRLGALKYVWNGRTSSCLPCREVNDVSWDANLHVSLCLVVVLFSFGWKVIMVAGNGKQMLCVYIIICILYYIMLYYIILYYFALFWF